MLFLGSRRTFSASKVDVFPAVASSGECPRRRVVLVQACFDYRFFLSAKFPVIKHSFIIEFIQLRPNLPPFFRTELGQCFEDLGLDHGRNVPRPQTGSKHALGQASLWRSVAFLNSYFAFGSFVGI